MKLQIPLTDKQAASWRTRIDSGKKYIERFRDDWKKQQAAYVGETLAAEPTDDVVLVNKDAPRVKQKVAQLFYQVPKIHLRPKRPDYLGAVSTFQSVLNHKLTTEMRVERVVDEVLTDTIAVSGIGVSKIGYEAVTVDVDTPLVSPQEAQLMAEQGMDVPTDKVPVPIFESYFWKRISPAKLLLPPEFVGTDFDEASWIGFCYRLPLEVARREYKLGDEADPSTKDEYVVTDATVAQNERTQKEVECTEIWYKASLFDKNERHPLKQRRLVYIEGKDEPVVHEDSPYQRFDENGKLVVGFKKFPIRVLTLMTVPDEAIPPSDTKVSRPLVSELQASRTQMVKQRKRALPMRWYNTALLDVDTAEKIQTGDVQDMIPVQAPGDQAIGEVARANYPRETFEFQRVIESDLQEAWALGSNQMGTDSPGEVSASEAKIIQGNTNVRLDYERNKVLRWFLDGAELIGDLVQLFADDEDYVEVVGPDQTRTLQAWDKTKIAGEFVYEAKTNSQLRLDVAQERMDARNAYQLMANEPFANRQKLVEKVAETHDMDPAQFLTQPPPKQPEPPNVSFRFSGDDLNPLNPSFPIVLQVLAAGGFQVPQQAVDQAKLHAAMMMATGGAPNLPTQAPGAPAQTEHGGTAQEATPLSKHQMDGRGR
jgi:hypothetical protein